MRLKRSSRDCLGAATRKEGMMSNNRIAPGGYVKNGIHCLQVRVYYADTDCSGFVYHGRYIEFLERGRSKFLRYAGIYHHELAQEKHGAALLWVIRRMEIDFKAPARLDDMLVVETTAETIAGARVLMCQRIWRNREVLVEAKVHVALINDNLRPRRIPKEWAERLRMGMMIA